MYRYGYKDSFLETTDVYKAVAWFASSRKSEFPVVEEKTGERWLPIARIIPIDYFGHAIADSSNMGAYQFSVDVVRSALHPFRILFEESELLDKNLSVARNRIYYKIDGLSRNIVNDIHLLTVKALLDLKEKYEYD